MAANILPALFLMTPPTPVELRLGKLAQSKLTLMWSWPSGDHLRSPVTEFDLVLGQLLNLDR